MLAARAWLLSSLLALSCTSPDPIELPHSDVDSGGAGGSGGSGGGSSGSPSDSGMSDAPDADLPDAPIAPVLVGIAPTPRFGAGTQPGPAAELEAQLDTIALGSRGVPLVRRWASLFLDGVQPVLSEWQRLENTAALYTKAGRGLLLCVAVVDRSLDARPAPLGAAWDAPVTRAGIEVVIDRTFNTFNAVGADLPYLALGTEVDRYLDAADPTQRAGLTALLLHALAYAKKHPGRKPMTRIGVTFSSSALMGNGPAEMADLIAASDVVVATYVPLDQTFRVRPASSVAGDLDALTSGLADAGPGLPVVLQEVGYPSSPEAGSSPEQQRAFFANLRQALASRRARHPFVGIQALHDAEPSVCQGEATAYGSPSNATLVAARCSLGLKSGSGEPKPAYSTALEALATFASP